MRLRDTVELVTTSVDGYGDRQVEVLTESKALFIQRSGLTRGTHSDGITSDAAVYLDSENPIIIENLSELEGMYITANPFGKKMWFRVQSANVAQRKLIDNRIDNIYCRLERVAEL